MSINSFICFANNKGLGGMLAEKIHHSLTPYCGKVFFSSADNRKYGTNYREEEVRALHDTQFFILVLTNELVDGMSKDAETLFEIRKALELSLKIIPVAESLFTWNKKRIRRLTRLLGKSNAQYLSRLDYICFFGIREYEKITEPELYKTLGITIKKEPPKSLNELKTAILKAQESKLFSEDNTSIIGNELLYFQQSFFTEPRKKINGLPKNDSLTPEIIKSVKLDLNDTWFFLGEVGCGKTTLMRKSFLAVSNATIDEPCLLLFLRAHEINTLCFRKETLLKDHLQTLGFHCSDDIVNALLQSYKLCFFIDALDELPQNDYSEISKALNGRSSDCNYYCSCRKNIFQYLQIKEINVVAELLGVPDNQRLWIADRFFDAEKINNAHFIEKAKEILINNEIFNNILLIVIYLLYLKERNQVFHPNNEYEIMERIMNWIVGRERDKHSINVDQDAFFRIMEKTAILFLKHRGFSGKIQYNELLFELFQEDEIEFDPSLLKTFLTVDPVTNACFFAHQKFYEFLIAKCFINLLNTNEDISKLVCYSFSIETNHMITDVFLCGERHFFLQQLIKAYEATNPNDYRTKLHLLNHMHRTSLYPEIKEFVSRHYENSKNDLDKILLFHSLLVSGDKEDEDRYYTQLISDDQFALLNASVTLSYYYGTNEKESFPLSDDGSRPWYPVFVGYKNHLIKRFQVPHYYKVLRINFFTARTFIIIRKSVDKEIADFYLSIKNDLQKDNTEFGQKIYREYLNLCSIIDSVEKV